jgi:DNA-binding transcriptional LysR family regulator
MNPTSTDWEDHRAFLAVLRTGSLSAAARALRVTQPTIRRRLESLERAVGAALFTRSPSGLTPTETARSLGAHAEAMAEAAEAFARAASAEAETPAGIVRITASDVMGAEVLPPILARLRRRHPGLVLELSLTNRSEDLLRQHADIAVRMVRPAQAALVARHVGAVRLGLFAHRAYLDANGTPASLAELGRFALIGPDRETADLDALRQSDLELRREMLALRTDSQLAQLAAIRAGLGIGLCHRALAARSTDLVAVLPDAFAYELPTWIAMHEDLRHVARIRASFDHLVREVGAYAAL